MAITQAMCTSFKSELLQAVHNFKASGGNSFKLALYTSSATMSASTTAYSTNQEASGTNYSAGGSALTNVNPTTSGTTAYTDFADLTFGTCTITARGCMIYNDTATGDPAVAVFDFGGDKTSTAGSFTISFPTADASNAVIRIAQSQPMANITGWGRSTWNSGTWGNPVPVELTGLAGTGAVSSLTITCDANVAETGVAATGAVSSLTVTGVCNLSVTGLAGTTALGTESVSADANVSETGVAATGAVGTVVANGVALVGVSGTASTVAQGDETVTCDANVYPTGLAGTSALGTLTLETNNIISVTQDAMTSSLGDITASTHVTIAVTGLYGTGEIGGLLVWSRVIPDQTPNWTDAGARQSPSYSTISPSQSPDWKDEAA